MVAGLSTVVETRQAPADALPFPDASFDVATAGFVLHLVPDPAAALAEIKRVLRPGGMLFFTIVGEWTPLPSCSKN
jgi:ubiquinone/menaquinone biosynthesis C-methylase UbiE